MLLIYLNLCFQDGIQSLHDKNNHILHYCIEYEVYENVDSIL